MRVLWSIPVRGEGLSSSRGDLVRARHLIAALRQVGHEVHVVEAREQVIADMSVSAYRRMIRDVVPGRAAYILRDIGRWIQGRAHGRRVAREARAHASQLIVETHVNFSDSGALAARAASLPLVLDDCSPSAEEEAFGTGLPLLSKLLLKRQVKVASTIVVSSEALRSRLVAEGLPLERLAVVPNGVDLGAVRVGEREQARARLGVGERCVFGFVGSFQPWHCVELLVDAAANLAKDYPIHLLLVGDGPGRESAVDAAKRAGLTNHMTSTGAVSYSEVHSLLSACDVGVLPGTNDYGQPMKLLDYGAAGLPSVAPDLPPVREVVRDGVDALLFRAGDSIALQSALARMAADRGLRRQLGARARERVPTGASWSDRACALISCMESSRNEFPGTEVIDEPNSKLKLACGQRLS